MMNKLRALFLGIFAVFIFIPISSLAALVFECQDETGKTLFQDSPCEHSSSQKVMTVPSQPTRSVSPKILKQQEKTLKKNYKQLNTEDKKALRLKTRVAQQELKTAVRAQKRASRLLQTEEKIAHIESQLRQGCKFKRANHLTEERERLQKMKARYSEQ